MKISAHVHNRPGRHDVTLRTNDQTHSIVIPPKSSGLGSSANGGELLFLALATCYCNDIYREAAKRGINVTGVEVTVEGNFGREGEPANNLTYSASVFAQTTDSEILDLMQHVDAVAEVHNTLRTATPVTLSRIEARSV
ncbi:MAG TPA: OsmC family protein [Candidatus Acidoferrum sp.]|nr:OsmC family protein [Candidatus Acidoferrum sp.]